MVTSSSFSGLPSTIFLVAIPPLFFVEHWSFFQDLRSLWAFDGLAVTNDCFWPKAGGHD